MRFENGYALIIGVGADLPCTVRDAQAVAQFLIDPATCAYPPEQVQLLTEEKATCQQVLAGLDTLAKQTNRDSTVVIYYSGHGLEVDGFIKNYFLLTHGYDTRRLDETTLLDQQFSERLRAIPAKKVLVLFDCCHAGGFDFTQLKAPLHKAPLPPHTVEQLGKGAGYAFIASCRSNERSLAAEPYSVFTAGLLHALSGVSVAKPDGYVRLTDLSAYLSHYVPTTAARLIKDHAQNPVLELERADNFPIAFYAGGETKPKQRALPDLALSEDKQPFVQDRVAVTGNKNTVVMGNGNTVAGQGAVIAAGDVHGPIITGTVSGGLNWGGQQSSLGENATLSGNVAGGAQQVVLNGEVVEALFAGIFPLVERYAPIGQRGEAIEAVQALQTEVKKGQKANDTVMAQLLGKLLEVVPNAVKAVGNLFALPILQGIAGPATQAVLRAVKLIP
jgi:hypothetical protein